MNDIITAPTPNNSIIKQNNGNIATKTIKDKMPQVLKKQYKNISEQLPAHLLNPFLLSAKIKINMTPALHQCDETSLAQSLIEAAALKFIPDTPLGLCYLVPYKGRCQLILGYNGALVLMRRDPNIINVCAKIVNKHDKFNYWVDEHGQHINHIPDTNAVGNDDFVGVYCLAALKSGEVCIEYMSKSQIIAHGDEFGNQNKMALWKKHPAQMGLKTVVLRTYKYLKSDEAINNIVVPEQYNNVETHQLVTDVEQDEIANIE